MAFPATPLLDDFNRSDSDPLIGWDAALIGSLVTDGSICNGFTASDNVAFYATTYTGNHECYLFVIDKPADREKMAVYVMAKQTASLITVDGYRIEFEIDDGGVDAWALQRVTNGSLISIDGGLQ